MRLAYFCICLITSRLSVKDCPEMLYPALPITRSVNRAALSYSVSCPLDKSSYILSYICKSRWLVVSRLTIILPMACAAECPEILLDTGASGSAILPCGRGRAPITKNRRPLFSSEGEDTAKISSLSLLLCFRGIFLGNFIFLHAPRYAFFVCLENEEILSV